MTSLLNALNAGKTSLLTNQKSIEVVGTNIANINTAGYSRQRADLSDVPALNFGDFFIGQGVAVTSVSRDYNLFINQQLQSKSIEYGEETGKSNSLAELERVFNIGKDNLATQINEFFDAWRELTTNPNGQVERDIVIQRGQFLGDAFQGITTELDTIQQNMNTEIAAEIDGLNEKIAEVARLNERISMVEVAGQSANAARDQRDVLLNELSEALGVQSYTDNRGMVNLLLPGGMPLVQGNMASTITTVSNGTDVHLQLQVAGSTLEVFPENLGGKMKGMFTIRDEFIAGLRQDLNTLARDFTEAINTEHRSGYGSDGVSGRDFFLDMATLGPNDVPSRNVRVVLTDGSQVAAAGNPAAAPGDNEAALRIAQLETGHKVAGTKDTFDSFYSTIVATVGIEAARNRLALSGARDATVQLQNLRDGYSGVSLEEEMIDLIQFQRGFESSAKFLATVDEMISTLLELKR
ncbi:flagellar hook-associated protein FlgK [Desulfobulbus oligotrophicus]|uniref:Flagellar hook-associated protein 1 n=1 Tax=Desulfobulbus oligotrophicus TaxID=1909699 RepID=A0A7T5VDQ3_9BACT|nr:flagellar hook-associated protein FlgK [Desulfobulbus oligotrophicus]QQG66004.1 flagellar hook-associated protein FlgK [Desulfobulbus oligotrophicus]